MREIKNKIIACLIFLLLISNTTYSITPIVVPKRKPEVENYLKPETVIIEKDGVWTVYDKKTLWYDTLNQEKKDSIDYQKRIQSDKIIKSQLDIIKWAGIVLIPFLIFVGVVLYYEDKSDKNR